MNFVIIPIIWISIIISSLRPIFKFLNDPLSYIFLFLYGLLLFTFLVIVTKHQIYKKKWFRYFSWLVFIIFISAVFFIYPMADNLKQSGRGSDQDDAIIVTAKSLLNLTYPYSKTTYFGNPISPGPGWILFCTPFVILGIYRLLTPLILLITYHNLKKTNSSTALLFLITMFSSILMWELSIVGSDLIALSLVFLNLFLLIDKKKDEKIGFWYIFWLSIFIGTISTGRIIFSYMPLLLAFSLYPYQKKNALILGIVGLFINLLWHYLFYLWGNRNYPPLHLIGRGSGLVAESLIFIIVAFLIVAFLMIKNIKKWKPSVHGLFGIGFPILVLAFMDLIERDFIFSEWGGANYFIMFLPFILCFLSDKISAKNG